MNMQQRLITLVLIFSHTVSAQIVQAKEHHHDHSSQIIDHELDQLPAFWKELNSHDSEKSVPILKNFHEHDKIDLENIDAQIPLPDSDHMKSYFSKDRVNRAIEHSRTLALTAFQRTTSSFWEGIYAEIWDELSKITVHWPRLGYDYKNCGTYTLAYTYTGAEDVYLCDRLRSKGLTYLSQTLIHEAAHTLGYGNECDATKIEVSTMRASRGGVVYRNGYWSKCRVD